MSCIGIERVKRIMGKRILCFVLMVLLLAPIFTAAAAGTTVKVNVPDNLPKAGEQFSVQVTISGNPGLLVAQFTLAYDKSVVECRNIKVLGALGEMLSAKNKDGERGAAVACAAAEPIGGDGVICEYTFQMLHSGNPGFALTGCQFSGEGNAKIPVDIIQSDRYAPEVLPEEPDDEPAEEPEPVPVAVISFSDVSDSFWGAADIAKAVSLGLFSGYPDGTFHPNDYITRADFVTVLWRAAGSPEPRTACRFKDVPADKYYTRAIAWASEKGYVNGTGDTTFDPFGYLQRQAAMKILFAYSGGKSGMELMLTESYDEAFADSGKIADWAKNAVYWGYYQGLINGIGGGQLSPTTGATRAQLAKILVNYLNKFSA